MANHRELTVVVVSYNMRREIPRTLYSLCVPYQRDIAPDDYEVVLVDNGSADSWSASDFEHLNLNLRIIHMGAAASPSPARALNRGILEARGGLICAAIDGARLFSPGMLSGALQAARLHARPIVATCGFHLGFEHQAISVTKGYGPEVEDRLLQRTGWESNGYRLLDVSTFNAACPDGWFGRLSETNALFLPRAMWREVDGFDEAFRLPGGGLVNLDLYDRVLALPDSRLMILLGEGTFHQVHGGVSSNAPANRWPEWAENYRRIRGREYRLPDPRPAVYIGSPGTHGVAHLEFSARNLRRDAAPRDPAEDYLDLLGKVLLNETHPELELAFLHARDMASGRVPYDETELLDAAANLPERFAQLLEYRREGRVLDGDLRNMPQAYTMIGRRRLDNLRFCVETAIRQGIPGDLVECGVWKGGACIYMRGILRAFGETNRTVWVADSFCGVPSPDPLTDENLDLSRERFPQLAVSLEAVQGYFERFGLLDEQVKFLPGWFCDTLPAAPVEQIAVLRLDGDLYSSTMDILVNLYDKVSPGGYLIVDDYGVIPQCARAVDEFRAARGIVARLEKIDITGVFWRKDF